MQIYINGAATHIATGPTSLTDLLENLNMSQKRVAIELNQNIIPRAQHADTWLQEGDSIEVIQAIAGG